MSMLTQCDMCKEIIKDSDPRDIRFNHPDDHHIIIYVNAYHQDYTKTEMGRKGDYCQKCIVKGLKRYLDINHAD